MYRSGGVTIKALLNIKRIVFNDKIKAKARQFTCDLVTYHPGNSNYVAHTYQIFITAESKRCA